MTFWRERHTKSRPILQLKAFMRTVLYRWVLIFAINATDSDIKCINKEKLIIEGFGINMIKMARWYYKFSNLIFKIEFDCYLTCWCSSKYWVDLSGHVCILYICYIFLLFKPLQLTPSCYFVNELVLFVYFNLSRIIQPPTITVFRRMRHASIVIWCHVRMRCFVFSL